METIGQYFKGDIGEYFKELTQHPPVTREIEIELSKSKNDKTNRKRLIESNLRGVVMIVKGYRNKGIDFTDLIQYGNLNLMNSIESYDPNKGKLLTYVRKGIERSINRLLAKESYSIKTPEQVYNDIKKIYAMTSEECTIKEISEEIKRNEKEVSHLINITQTPSSYNDISREIPNNTDDPTKYSESLPEIIGIVEDVLSQRDSDILKLRFGLDGQEEHTLERTGEKHDLSPEGVRKAEIRAFKKLRKDPRIKELEYLVR